MGSEWISVPLVELTSTPPTYGVVQPGQHTPDGVPMVRVNNFQGHTLNLAEVMYVSPSIERKYERTRIQAGDVLITIVGSVGQVAIASDELSGWNIARAVAMIRPKEPSLSRWISFALRSPDVQYQLGIVANTTVQTTINLKDLRQLRIPLPEKNERYVIAHILGTLDEKIELNRRMNETLEAMARALFKAWFVDFEPVRAKMAGQKPQGMDEETAALFPDTFEKSALGLIPKGWTCESLDQVATYLNGLALQKFPPIGINDLPVIKISQLRKGNTGGADRAARSIKPEYIIKNGDVLFSWSGTLEVEIWCGGEGALNQHLFKVTSKKFQKWFYYLWTRHHLANFRLIAAGKATTMGHIQREHLTAAKVVVPDHNILLSADRIFSPLIDQIIENLVQSQTLAALRDTLLPKLLSGELRVPEVMRIMEDNSL